MGLQVKHVFKWCKDRAGFEPSFRVIFYPAEYNKRMLGIFPIGDPIPYVPEEEVQAVSVLEAVLLLQFNSVDLQQLAGACPCLLSVTPTGLIKNWCAVMICTAA